MKKYPWILLGITGMFLCILLGIFIGRNLRTSYIPLRNENNQSASTNGSQNQADGRIDINTASAEQLQLIPGIGEVLAQRIIDYRTEHTAFTSVEELMEISGIGQAKFAQMKPYVKIGGNHEDSGS